MNRIFWCRSRSRGNAPDKLPSLQELDRILSRALRETCPFSEALIAQRNTLASLADCAAPEEKIDEERGRTPFVLC